MPEAAVIALRLRQLINYFPLSAGNPIDYHLGDPVAPFNDKRLFAEICHDHLYLSPVVRIDGAGSIEEPYAVMYCQTAPGPHRSGAAPALQSPAAARCRCRWG